MKNNNLISIVLPVYNGEKYLAEAIESIRKQTYKEFELIVVNDCSTDGTEKIVRDYINRDNRIRLINNESNKKLPCSLNIGFSNARGSYLTWTSDDNCYQENALYVMYQYMKKFPEYGMVYTDMIFIDAEGERIGRNTSKEGDLFLYNCIGACFLYKRECKMQIGDYDEKRFLVEDYDYWIRMAKRYKIGHIEQGLYYYRFHEESLSFTKMKAVGEQQIRMKNDYIADILPNLTKEESLSLLFEFSVCGKKRKDLCCTQIIKKIGTENDISWIFDRKEREFNKKMILFGAGAVGLNALHYLGYDCVAAFADNNEEKIGYFIETKKVLSFSELKEVYSRYQIVISTDIRKAYYIAKQLEKHHIKNYIVFYELLEEIDYGIYTV